MLQVACSRRKNTVRFCFGTSSETLPLRLRGWFPRGMVGEWKNYFTPEQNERFEKEVLEKLRGRETTGNSSINDIEYWYRYQPTLLVYVGRLHSLHRKACVAGSVIRTKVEFLAVEQANTESKRTIFCREKSA